jgi:hypothetical protein
LKNGSISSDACRMRALANSAQLGLWPRLIPLLLYGIHCGMIFNCHVDDAFISQVYARTWIENGIFAYSAGDVPHYGISNPLWAAILAIPHLIGLHSYMFEKALCISLGGAAIATVVQHTFRLFPENNTRGRVIAMGRASRWRRVGTTAPGQLAVWKPFALPPSPPSARSI